MTTCPERSRRACPERSRRVPVALSRGVRVADDEAADIGAPASAGGLAASAWGAVACAAGVSMVPVAIRDVKVVSAEGIGTRQSGTTRAVTGTSAAAAIAHVQ